MVKVLKYIETSDVGKPSFLIEIDGVEFISNGCVFIENTKENIDDLLKEYDCKVYIDELLNSKDIESLSKVTNMSHMFRGAKSFNQDISSWNTSNVKSMSFMFSGVESFNQDLSSWNTSNVKSMSLMFSGAESFNQDLNSWDVSNVTYMYGMFWGAETFNQDLSNWNTSNVTNMNSIFCRSGLTNLPSWYKN
jgi:surface protein